MTNLAEVAADWHTDPSGVHQLRFWDGSAWTEHVSDHGTQSIDPLRTAEQIQRDEKRALKDAARDELREKKAAEKAVKAATFAEEWKELREKQAADKSFKDAARDKARKEAAEKKAFQDEHRALVKEETLQREERNPSSTFGGATVRGGMLTYKFESVDVKDATAEAAIGLPAKRSTLTRMGAGVLVGGAVGLAVGAIVRKDTSKCYVTVSTPYTVVVVEGLAKNYPAAVKFADAINRSQG